MLTAGMPDPAQHALPQFLVQVPVGGTDWTQVAVALAAVGGLVFAIVKWLEVRRRRAHDQRRRLR